MVPKLVQLSGRVDKHVTAWDVEGPALHILLGGRLADDDEMTVLRVDGTSNEDRELDGTSWTSDEDRDETSGIDDDENAPPHMSTLLRRQSSNSLPPLNWPAYARSKQSNSVGRSEA